ncbi:hypothetical protein [Legionella tunisiensis]|uniref:hypothetical protein n=1 Tax=Legionella tunisiensis TaxID=1034944 RepID=UPI0012E9F3A5|nr:hypothetical protein [Legionella tunisiensis]
MKRYRFMMILLCIFISPLLWAKNKVLKIAVAIYDPPFVMQIASNQFYGFDIAMIEKCMQNHRLYLSIYRCTQ